MWNIRWNLSDISFRYTIFLLIKILINVRYLLIWNIIVLCNFEINSYDYKLKGYIFPRWMNIVIRNKVEILFLSKTFASYLNNNLKRDWNMNPHFNARLKTVNKSLLTWMNDRSYKWCLPVLLLLNKKPFNQHILTS